MRRISLTGCVLVVFAVLVLCVGAAVYVYAQAPQLVPQAAPPRLFVTLSKPLDNSSWYLYSPIPVTAQAVSDKPIKSFELWVDGTLVQSQDVKLAMAFWTYVLKTEGDHTLIARAIDSDGNMAQSNVVRVKSAHGTPPGLVLVHTVTAGETVANLATTFKTQPENILALNPTLATKPVLTVGEPVKIPIQPALPTLPTNNAPASIPNTPPQQPAPYASSFIPSFVLKNFTSVPKAPGIALLANQCSVNILVTDPVRDQDGFYIYRLDPNTQTFSRIATIGAIQNPAQPIQYTDANLFGNFSYYVSAFNAAGETPGNLAGINLTDISCNTGYWKGKDFSVSAPITSAIKYNGIPQLIQVEKDYFYYSINPGMWTRVPADVNAFLTPKNGIFNVDDAIQATLAMPTQGTITVTVDAWGWQSDQLIHLGKFTRTLQGQASLQPILPTLTTSLKLEVCNEAYDPAHPNCTPWVEGKDVQTVHNDQFQTDALKLPFYWTPLFRWTAPQKETYGIYQIWSFPLPAGSDCDPNIPGMIGTGLIGTGGDITNTFHIDLSKYEPAQEFSIRVLALSSGGQPVCALSNVIHISVAPVNLGGPQKPAAPVPPALYDVKITNFTPIHFPDYTYAYCVHVTANPFYNNPQAAIDYATQNFDFSAAAWVGAAVDSTVCPTPYVPKEPSFWDDVGNFLENVVNFVAGIYNGLKSLVVKLVTDLNPLCLQAKLGTEVLNKYQGSVDNACHAISEAAVDVGLAYVGLPPSLPNYDELENVAEGNATDAIADEFEDETGLPCEDTCRGIIKSGLDQMIAAAKQSANDSACLDTDSAHAEGFEPLCQPDGVTTTPEPAGQTLPAMMTLQVTRNADVPDSALPDPNQFKTSCALTVGVSGTNDLTGQSINIGLNWTTLKYDYWQGGPIQGALFNSQSVRIPKLSPGQSASIPLVLTTNHHEWNPQNTGNFTEGYWLPGHESNEEDYVSHEQILDNIVIPDDWRYLYFGATATASANGTCTTSADGYQSSTSKFGDQLVTPIPNVPH